MQLIMDDKRLEEYKKEHEKAMCILDNIIKYYKI